MFMNNKDIISVWYIRGISSNKYTCVYITFIFVRININEYTYISTDRNIHK